MLDSTNEMIARELYSDARSLIRNGELRDARQKLEKALRLVPPSEHVHFGLAYLDWSEGRMEDAERRLTSLSAKANDSLIRAESLLYLGNIMFDRGELEAAEGCYAAVLQIESLKDLADAPRLTADSLTGCGMVAKERGDLERAVEQLSKATRVDPANVTALNHLAHCLYLRGEYSDAVKIAELGLTQALDNPGGKPLGDMWLHVGAYYEAAGLLEKARECYKQAASLGEDEARVALESLSK